MHPIFLDYLEESEFWRKLKELDDSISLPLEASEDVDSVVVLSVLFTLLHEIAHAILEHPRFLVAMQGHIPEEFGSMPMTDIRKGVELLADVLSAELTISFMLGEIKGRGGQGSLVPVSFLRFSYAVTLTLSLFDTTRKFLGSYDRESHAHPMARHMVITEAVNHMIAHRFNLLTEVWKQQEVEGWRRCVLAFHRLTLATMEEPDDRPGNHWIVAVPSSMVYGLGAATEKIQKIQGQMRALLGKTSALYEAYMKALVLDP